MLVASLACVAGALRPWPVYSAVKAFQHNLRGRLVGRIACRTASTSAALPLGMTYTPALQRMGVPYDPATQSCSPRTWRARSSRTSATARFTSVGEDNRAIAASMVWTVDRRTLVEMIERSGNGFRRSTGGTAS